MLPVLKKRRILAERSHFGFRSRHFFKFHLEEDGITLNEEQHEGILLVKDAQSWTGVGRRKR